MDLNKEHVAIMRHTAERAARNMYCGDSKEMQELVAGGLMRSLGKKSFGDDEYFGLTEAGRVLLATIESEQRNKQGSPIADPVESSITKQVEKLIEDIVFEATVLTEGSCKRLAHHIVEELANHGCLSSKTPN